MNKRDTDICVVKSHGVEQNSNCAGWLRGICLLFILLLAQVAGAQESISLSGVWDLSLGDEPKYNDRIVLPNSLLTAGKGEDVTVDTRWTGSTYDSSYYFNPFMKQFRVEGNVKYPFFLTPDKHYVGRAWYRRTVEVPKEWKGKHITLTLERPHIETTVYVNGQEAGYQNSLSAPHEFDLTSVIRPGERNEIVLCIYNGIENVGVGQDSHSVTDQTQGNWNGVTGKMLLTARPVQHIRSVRVTPDVTTGTIRVEVKREGRGKMRYEVCLLGQTGIRTEGLAVGTAGEDGVCSSVRLSESNVGKVTGTVKEDVFEIPLGDGALLWDEFHPNLYTLTLSMGKDTVRTQFGLREVCAQGRQLYINDRPLFLRGTVENCTFPDTGYPPTDINEWLRIFGKCKEYGLNHVRFHSFCPPEAAFEAADQLGLYLQPEGPSWPNHGVKLGQGEIIDQYLMDETQRMIDAYGNHPSFCFMAVGNEPAGPWVAWCKKWTAHWREQDPRRLYAGASVGGGWQWDEGSDYHVKGGARGLNWNRSMPQTTDDYLADITLPRNFKPTEEQPTNTEPFVSHEKGQWCTFPDLDEVSQYKGAYKAKNFDIFRALLAHNGMESQATKFLWASGRLQQLCYRMEMERNLRTPDYSGFQLLGLNDYSGQGTALVGVLNVFWREKGYTDAREWTQSCAPKVILAKFPKFVYTSGETLDIPLTLYNATAVTVPAQSLRWEINSATQHFEGTLDVPEAPIGKERPLGKITQTLKYFTAPAKYTLSLAYAGVQKQYEFWVYPGGAETAVPEGIYQSDTLDAKAIATLQAGGIVLLTAAGRVTLGSDVRQDYLPVFWNTSWFKMKPPHTTGCTIDTSHPLFRTSAEKDEAGADFVTDDWGNLNWWELLNRAQVMNLEELPAWYQSPVQPIDTWHVSRKLGMVVEARVLNGRLLMTTMDIQRDLARRPVAAQMRRALLRYMRSDDFAPMLRLDTETVADFFTKHAAPVKMYTNEKPDELKPRFAN